MDIGEASQIILNHRTHNYGNFYGGQQENLSLGVGQIYKSVRFPLLDKHEHVYDTVEGLVYILTHECDIDQANERPFNDMVIVCLILPLEECIEILDPQGEEKIKGFINELARDNINRVAYFPAIKDHLPSGGVLYLNQLAHSHISAFELAEVKRVEALTTNGLKIIDYKVSNHLLRPKSQTLALSRY